jgi:shikimate dehydrogenase
MTMTGKAMLAGVIGWPVAHSRSPAIHNAWIAQLGLDAAYVPLPVAPGALKTAIAGLAAAGFRGANVTIPHKEEAFALCGTLDPAAQAIGAVNTLVFRDGRIEGFNTDTHGFSENLKAQTGLSAVSGLCALVLGAGGSSRAIVHALKDLGAASIRIANRTRARADDLAVRFGVEAIDWDARHAALAGADVIVNTTSLGMGANPVPDLDWTRARPGAIVTDIVYTPLQTQFLTHAAKAGCRPVTGLGMLVHQARPGFTHWYGASAPDAAAMIAKLEKELGGGA